ncbi:hypothetical protein [Jeotgalibacillus salarius]|uniref:Uncharacterized protein n=1 Tax=Jeotgalibacillus salarius TaxID=546023 RepID=A0A4Y8LI44_9BACL|nr:hypothetical protein [Jeotgalibacillus salarius]TFE02414.1 hypothetical protein E2626_07510 [Jeotgalibacillus salarius]
MNPKKLIYATFHIIGPILYFFAYITMQYLNGVPLSESMSDALSIIAIYLVGVSILWLFSMDKLDKAIEADKKAKQQNQS